MFVRGKTATQTAGSGHLNGGRRVHEHMAGSETDEHQRERVLAVALVGLLAVTLLSVNVISVLQQTALSRAHVVDTFDDEDVYTDVAEEMQANFVERVSPAERNANELAEIGFSTNYTRAEINRNIDETYAFLDGERDTVDIELNYTPVRQRIAGANTTAETQQGVNESLSEDVTIRENLDEGALGTARPVASNLQGLFLASAVLVLVLLGIIVYRSRSYRQTAKRAGVAISVAAVLSLLVVVVLFVFLNLASAPPPAEDEIDPELVFAGIFGVLESVVITLLTQSVALLGLGAVLVWVGRDEPIRPPVPSDDEDDSDTPETGENESESSV
jgi:hypothetical protein